MKKISVIIPVFNAEKYLANCLDSILNQTYPVYEIIIVNDGSMDSSEDICNLFQKRNRIIRVVNKDNEGVSKARNIGLQYATGELISFIDSDDALEFDMYEYLVSLLENYDADISHCGYKRVNEEGICLKECSGTHTILKQNSAEAIECMVGGKYFAGGLWNKLYKKEILTDLRFEEQLKNNEDILFNALAFQKSNTIVFGDETKYLYFEHDSSACNTLGEERKTNDARNSALILIKAAKTDQIRKIAQNWLFNIELSSYKASLVSKNRDKTNNKSEQQWLRQNYKEVQKRRLSERLSYYLSVYFPGIFRSIYMIRKKVVKPKWDPEL